VIGLGLRLVITGGREAVTRLIVLAAAVGLGVGLLLAAVAATNAVTAWNNRHAWQFTGTAYVPADSAQGFDPLWWHPGSDTHASLEIARFDVAATGPTSPVPPGIPRDPGPGQYYASPALAALLHAAPASQLADRYPGRMIGTIGDAGLPSPSSLIIIIGRSPAQLAGTPGTAKVSSIAPAVPSGSFQRVNLDGLLYTPPDTSIGSHGIDLVLSVVALAVLAPVLIFISTATRLSAARREQRFAAMRLAGATRGQVSMVAAVESTAATLLGVAVGFGIFFLLRVPVASIPFVTQPFFPSEMSLNLLDVLAAVIGVPAAAAVAARLALRRVHISPLGVARRTTPRPPGAWRVVPLLAGLAELVFWTTHGHPASISGQIEATVSSFLLIIIGLVIAGPWLTMAAARVMARWTGRPGTLIAARRLADDPRAAFRAVSGLVLALFITTVAVVAITTQDAKDQTRWGGTTVANLVSDQLADQPSDAPAKGQPTPTSPGPAAPATPLAARLGAIPGVQGVVVVRADPQLTIPGAFHDLDSAPVPAGVISCAQLKNTPALGRCPAGATTAAFPKDGFSGPLFGLDTSGFTWPAANVPASRLDSLQVDAIHVATDGSAPAVEQARTVLENASAYPSASPPSTFTDLVRQSDVIDTAYRQLANTVILVSLPIAGCTLATGIAAGLAERKRPFSLLRLTGARLATLRHVLALESAVPLLAVAAVAIGTGFGAAALFASEAQQHPMVAPGIAYYIITAGGILLSLAIIAATFPLLARITGPETARND
jgi:hypothetical protein